ncbi:uncharacterized protein [Salminus brasiliensis]|uniref:uncharacterized protein n=1 Tax=Salminus brasiliensis TaxID=930266 RepID=UPI003B837243
MSILTFLTQDSDLDTVINCTAKYKSQSPLSYEEESESALLKLGYLPRIKQESACSKTLCVCVVESRPPSIITWILSDGQSTLKRTETKEHRVEDKLNISVLNDRLVYCQAVNSFGNATVSFSLGGVLVLYIVVPVLAVIIIILLASIGFLWRYRIQQTKKNTLSMVPNPVYKMTETQTQNPTKPKAPRRAAPPIPECTDRQDTEHTEDNNYIFPVRQ